MAESSNISRSGRVRKKSSRLADFESPDDLDVQRFRKGCDTDAKGTTNRQASFVDRFVWQDADERSLLEMPSSYWASLTQLA